MVGSIFHTEADEVTVVTTRSEKAVMLVLSRPPHFSDDPSCVITGAFLTSEKARNIAAQLLRFAKEADALKDPTPEQRKEMIARFTMGDQTQIYDLFRKTPEKGLSSYLGDHYKRGMQGVMRPSRGQALALAAWKAGRDTAKEEKRSNDA